MTKLANDKQEKYCNRRARGMIIIDSYIEAGYQSNTGNASKLENQPHILARIAELRDIEADREKRLEEGRSLLMHEGGDPEDITLRWIQMELIENLRNARRDGNVREANNAIKMIAQTVGLLTPGKQAKKADPNDSNSGSKGAHNVQTLNKALERLSGLDPDELKSLPAIADHVEGASPTDYGDE